MGFIEKLQAKIELYRLEQRYARRKHRSTFSGVQYVDGEYVYSNGSNSPTGTVSKHSTGSYWKTPTWGGSGSESRWRWWTNLTLFHFLSLLPTGPLYILGIMFMRRIWWRFRSHMNACYSIFSRSFMGTDGPSLSDIEDMRPHFPIVICDHFTSKSKGLGHSCWMTWLYPDLSMAYQPSLHDLLFHFLLGRFDLNDVTTSALYTFFYIVDSWTFYPPSLLYYTCVHAKLASRRNDL